VVVVHQQAEPPRRRIGPAMIAAGASDEATAGRSAVTGAALGFAAVTTCITVIGTIGGMEPPNALGIGAFVGTWGGAGFGFMLGGTIPLARRQEDHVVRSTHHRQENQMTLQLGDTAPDFTADTTEGSLGLHEYLGDSWGILFSHPADFTPVCTTELGEFARRQKEFTDRDTKLIGVSVNSVESHRGWSADIEDTQGCGLNFPVVGDEERTVAGLYGMIHPNAIATETVRTVFVIGPDKKVKLTLTYPAAIGRNVDEIIRVLDALQLSAEHAVSTPVNWSEGDDVIISPAISDKEAAAKFPKGFRTLKPYLRMTPHPDR
jgi:thioredoxin-dependent peroxiredoxin